MLHKFEGVVAIHTCFTLLVLSTQFLQIYSMDLNETLCKYFTAIIDVKKRKRIVSLTLQKITCYTIVLLYFVGQAKGSQAE